MKDIKKKIICVNDLPFKREYVFVEHYEVRPDGSYYIWGMRLTQNYYIHCVSKKKFWMCRENEIEIVSDNKSERMLAIYNDEKGMRI